MNNTDKRKPGRPTVPPNLFRVPFSARCSGSVRDFLTGFKDISGESSGRVLDRIVKDSEEFREWSKLVYPEALGPVELPVDDADIDEIEAFLNS